VKRSNPPRWAEYVLLVLLRDQNRDAVLGDFREIFDEKANNDGLEAARRWYWIEAFSSTPHLVYNLINKQIFWRRAMTDSTLLHTGPKTALWGTLFLIPALLIAVPGMLFTLFGYSDIFDGLQIPFNLRNLLVHPAVVLGGLTLAILINLLAVIKLRVENERNQFVGTILLKKSAWNLIPLILGGLLAVVIFLYLVAENLGPFF
jgi:hypothetical protein